MPFSEVGIAFGENSYDLSSAKRKLQQGQDWSYTRLIFAFGTEFKFDNLLPYIRFAFSDINYSDESVISTTTNGKTKDVKEQLKSASLFSKLLASPDLSEDEVKKKLLSNGFEVDYVEKYKNRRLGVIKLDGVRLIDNCEV